VKGRKHAGKKKTPMAKKPEDMEESRGEEQEQSSKDLKKSEREGEGTREDTSNNLEKGEKEEHQTQRESRKSTLGTPSSQHKSVSSIVSKNDFRRFLEKLGDTPLRTPSGIKSAREIAKNLKFIQRLDIEGKGFSAKIRKDKVLVRMKGRNEDVEEIVGKLKEAVEESEKATEELVSSVGKGSDFPTLGTARVPSTMFPDWVLESYEKARKRDIRVTIEKLTKYMKVCERDGYEPTIFAEEVKALLSLAMLSSYFASELLEESEGGEESNIGYFSDYASGTDYRFPINPVRTIVRAFEKGGVIDDETIVREVRKYKGLKEGMLVVDASGSMSGYRIFLAILTAYAFAQKYKDTGLNLGLIAFTSNPALIVDPNNTDVDKVVLNVLRLRAGGGTSYAKALELAIRTAKPDSIIFLIGDFEDYGRPPDDVIALKTSKNLTIIGILTFSSNIHYARLLCDKVLIVNPKDPTGTALALMEEM